MGREAVLVLSDFGQSISSLTLRLLFFKMQFLEQVPTKPIFLSVFYHFLLCPKYAQNNGAVFSLCVTIIKYTLAFLYLLQKAGTWCKVRERK